MLYLSHTVGPKRQTLRSPCFPVNGVRAVKSKPAWGWEDISTETALGCRRQHSPHGGGWEEKQGMNAGHEDHWLGPKEKVVSITKVAMGLPRLDREDAS